MEHNNLEINLIILLNLFANRPNHLAKYLLENDALSDRFKKLIEDSDKLNKDITECSESMPDFADFAEMYNFFDKLINESTVEEERELMPKSPPSEELNKQLFEFLRAENYEEAIKIRDYMISNNIKIII